MVSRLNDTMVRTDVDYLIVGQGLAGSALAWNLIHAGRRVLVFDDGHRTAASRVAAGLINPLAGMRFTRRPEIDCWLAGADAWYSELETACDGPVRYDTPMLRLFRSPEQRRFHRRRRSDPLARGLLGPAFASHDCPESVAAPFGGFVQNRTGYVALPRLLDGVRSWLHERRSLITQTITPAALETDERGVRFGRYRAGGLVFCDGAQLVDNPWFNYLPITPDKGEILTVRSAEWRPRHIINAAHWLLPHADGALRFGATHAHHDRSMAVTATARETLLEGLKALAPQHRFDVIDQQAGIRPATRDRSPFLGRHPKVPTLWICNGFGSRGALTIPWYTERLARHLVENAELPQEADIRRFDRAP